MDDEPIFYIFRRKKLVTSFWCPYGFFLFHYFGAIYIYFLDANKSKYWLSWGELIWAYLNIFSNIFMIFNGSM
jgi:hypothetical protein